MKRLPDISKEELIDFVNRLKEDMTYNVDKNYCDYLLLVIKKYYRMRDKLWNT